MRFRRANQHSERERLVLPRDKLRRLYRVGTCVRRRLPLQLAWAITVHKSQGMSLAALQVELGNAFAAGQAYVGLSRATSLGGLRVTSFAPEAVSRHLSHESKRFHDAVRAESAARRLAAERCEAARASTRTQLAADGREASAVPADARLATAEACSPLAAYYARNHFWWKDVLEGAATHAGWANVFRGNASGGTTFASEFRRWEAAYAVPERLRKLRDGP